MPLPPKKINLIYAVLLAIFGLAIFILPGLTLAQTGDQVLEGLEQTGTNAGFQPEDNKPKVEFAQAFSDYAIGFATIMGAFFMILVIYSGWLWMSARGNEDQVDRAKKRLLAAVIGLAVIIAARIIAEIALYALSGTINVQ